MNMVTQENKYLFFGLYASTAIIGLVGNLVIIRTLWKQLKLRYYFHLQLAVANSISLMSITMAAPSALQGRWLFGDVMCKLFGFQAFMAGFAEMTFICLICIECYLALNQKRFYEKLTPNVFMVVSFMVWGYAVFFSVVPIIGWSSYVVEPHGASCTLDMFSGSASSHSYLMTTQAAFLTFACAAVVCILMVKCSDQSSSNGTNQLISDQDSWKIALYLFCVLGVCCAPFYIRVIWYLWDNSAFFDSFIGVEFSHIAMKFGSASQPFVYFMVSSKLKLASITMVTGLDTNKKQD